MARETKYRAWDTELSVMHHAVECGVDTGVQWSFGDLLISSRFSLVMQFTGLRDKNGKEIYEGDVLQYKDVAYSFDTEDEIMVEVVRWGDEQAAWMLVCPWSGEMQTAWDGVDPKKSEVIGNIHENPELIEQ